jgi:hypothetical protein
MSQEVRQCRSPRPIEVFETAHPEIASRIAEAMQARAGQIAEIA